MTIDENKKIMRRYIEESVNTGNVDILGEFISPNYAETFAPNGKTLGVEVAEQHIPGTWRDRKYVRSPF